MKRIELFYAHKDFVLGLIKKDNRWVALEFKKDNLYQHWLPPTAAEEKELGKFYAFEFPDENVPEQSFGGRIGRQGTIFTSIEGVKFASLDKNSGREGFSFSLEGEALDQKVRINWHLVPVEIEPIPEPGWEGLYGEWKLVGPWGREWLLNGFLEDVVKQMVEIALGFMKPGAIETTHYQNWKVVAFLRGLGFRHERTEYGDEFISPFSVEQVWAAWGDPSRDGSRLQDWSDLSDPASPHFGRRYVEAFRFTTPEGHENVVAFSASPHNSGELQTLIGLSSYRDWKVMVEDESERFGFAHWLEYNGIDIR